MADKTVSIKIKAAPTPETTKALNTVQKIATNWDKVFGPNGDKPVKNQKRQIDTLRRAWDDLGKSIRLARENFEGGFTAGAKSLSGLKTFTSGIDGATKKVLNLKNALMATAVGGAAIWTVKRILAEGAEDIKTRKRIGREFGEGKGSYGEFLTSLGDRVGIKGGMQGDEAARGLIPLAEQLEAIQAGAQFRGMSKPLTEAQAQALKRKNLTFGGGLLQRLGALVPDMEPEELGRVLGDALAGPEGVRSLVSTLHLSKRSKTLSQLNEKGQAYKALSPEERKRLGVTKAGQFLEQGDLVNLLLERSGLTDKAAEDERKTAAFQIKSIKAQLGDALGDIGSGALDTLTEKLGQGATAAERLQSYLASPEGKKTVDSIKDGVVTIVEGVVSLARQLPAIGAWLKEHKTLLEILGAAYVAGKVAPGVAGVVGGVKAAGSVAGAVGGGVARVGKYALGAAAGTTAAVAAATGLAIYGAHKGAKYIDDHTSFYDRLVGGGKEDAAGEAKNKARIEFLAQRRQALVQALEAKGISHALALNYADHPAEATKARPDLVSVFQGMGANIPPFTVNLVVDGQTLARVTDKHLGRDVYNRTAGGAAPVSRQ